MNRFIQVQNAEMVFQTKKGRFHALREIDLGAWSGLTHEEIADHTRLPLGTVKSQIRRALQTLRQILGDECAWALAS